MKIVVVSAVSLTEAGGNTILNECLDSAARCLPRNWRIIALVNRAPSIRNERIQFLSFPSAKRSWLLRLYWEWLGFYVLARRLQPHLWLSLHDITPRLPPCTQIVYCHNPAPFYKITPLEALLSPGFFAFNFCMLIYTKYLFGEIIPLLYNRVGCEMSLSSDSANSHLW